MVVTGGARGMGRAYVRGFLEKGARVVALDRAWEPTGLSADRDDVFARELRRRDDALALTCDITDVEQIQYVLGATVERFGTVDVLINNANLLPNSQFPPSGEVAILDTTDTDWHNTFEVGLFGTLKVTRAFVKPMLQQRSGSIIAVSSGGGNTMPLDDGYSWAVRRPASREMPYQSAKAAVTALFCYLADEVKPYNVAVNVINPTGARTTGWEEKVKAREAAGEMQRPRAKPEHVVPLALYLAEQDAATGITGRIFDTIAWNMAHGLGGPEVWMAD